MIENIKLVNEGGKIVGKDPKTGVKIPIEFGDVGFDYAETKKLCTNGTRIGDSDDAKSILEAADPYDRFIFDTTDTVETDEIEIMSEGVEIIGADLRLAKQGQNLLSIQANGVTVSSCILDGDSDPDNDDNDGQDALLYIGGDNEVKNVTVEKCHVHHAGDSGIGVGTDTFDVDDAYNITVRDCCVWKCGDDGITYHEVNGGLIENCSSWGHTDNPGASYGFEIEWATNDVMLINCHAFDTERGGFDFKSGGGDPPFNCKLVGCSSWGHRINYGFSLGEIEEISDNAKNHGMELIGCYGGPAEDANIRVTGYEVTINGGRFEQIDEMGRAMQIRGDEGTGLGTQTKFVGAGELIDGRIQIEGGENHYIGNWNIEEDHEAIRFKDGAGETVIERVRTEGCIRDGGSDVGPVYLRQCDIGDFIDLNEMADNIIPDGWSHPYDLRTLGSEEGAQGYHDGSGENTEGPAFHDGDDWISLVDGEIID